MIPPRKPAAFRIDQPRPTTQRKKHLKPRPGQRHERRERSRPRTPW